MSQPHPHHTHGLRGVTLAAGVLVCIISMLMAPVAQAQIIELDGITDVEASGKDEWLYNRWSWLHEWEAHYRHYLLEPSLIVPVPADAPVPDRPSLKKLRELAVTSLINASQPGMPVEVRVQAVIALGYAGTDESVDRLLQLLNDRNDDVSEVAWMALGLSSHKEAVKKLLDPGILTSRQTQGWIVAIAMMKEAPQNVLKTLAELIKQDKDYQVARMALWAMGKHNPPDLLDAARLIADKSPDLVMAADALLILGKNRQTQDISMLKGVLQARGRGVLESTQRLVLIADAHMPTFQLNIYSAHLSATRVAAAIALGEYVLPPEDKHSIRAREALRVLFESPPVPLPDPKIPRWFTGFEYTAALPYEVRFAAVSLGRVGYADDAELLIRVLQTPRLSDFAGRVFDARYFMRRGYAALALGTYLRRMTDLGIVIAPADKVENTDRSATADPALWRNNGPLEGEDGSQTRYAIRKTLRTLIGIASDPSEPYDLRAACVLALGMSNSPARQADIRSILQSPGGKDPIVAAYGVLALGLLGDPETVIGAGKYLKLPDAPAVITADSLEKMAFTYKLSPGQILATRAVLQGVGKIESTQSVEVARNIFGREPWTSRQAVLTLRLLGDLSLVEPVSEFLDRYPKLLKQEPKTPTPIAFKPTASQMAALSAWTLGQLLRAELDDPLARVFQQDGNYTMPLAPVKEAVEALRRESSIYRFRTYADPTFYEYLTPCIAPRVDIRFRY